MHLNVKFLALILSCSFNVHAADNEILEPTATRLIKGTACTVLDEPFALPDDTNQWRQHVTDYMAPLLTTSELQEIWDTLLDLTIINTPNKEQRAVTIQETYNTLKGQNDGQKLTYLKGSLTHRHRYMHQN